MEIEFRLRGKLPPVSHCESDAILGTESSPTRFDGRGIPAHAPAHASVPVNTMRAGRNAPTPHHYIVNSSLVVSDPGIRFSVEGFHGKEFDSHVDQVAHERGAVLDEKKDRTPRRRVLRTGLPRLRDSSRNPSDTN